MALPKGSKGGGSKPHQPYEMEDNLVSINRIKMLIALSDGEVDGEITGKDILINDTQIISDEGVENLPGITWAFRPGTQEQEYIQGFEETSNEQTIARPVTTKAPFTLTVTDKQLSAIRFKLMTDTFLTIKDNGDRVGARVEYAFDMSVDGAAFTEVLRDVKDGKTTKAYDWSHRINLPQNFRTQVVLRVRRITPDSTTSDVIDAFRVQSYAQLVDAKFRYPLTSLLYVEMNSDLFPNQVPSVTVRKRWKLIQVPSNYDPISRNYTGTWNGLFKWAYSNNPAWVLYDLITNQRYGLDQRELGIVVDKWSLYEAGVYCDEKVPDGRGGMENRYQCDMVIQERVAAYQLIRDVASIFRGMTFYNGESLSVIIDKPRDASYLFTPDNVVGGAFSYATASEQTRYTSVMVSFDNQENNYNSDVTVVSDRKAQRRYGNNVAEIAAIGCVRESEAIRRGNWLVKTNQSGTTVSFSVGLEGFHVMVGDVIAVADPFLQSNLERITTGRVSSFSGFILTSVSPVDVKAGDRIFINRDDGKPEYRTVASVNSNKTTIRLNTGFSKAPDPGDIFAVESNDLALQYYIVNKLTKGEGDEEFVFTITASEYNRNKYIEVDNDVNLDKPPITIVPPDAIDAPKNVAISSYSRVYQGQSIETMVVSWDRVPYASRYEMQWRKSNGNWVNSPITANMSAEIEGIYAGIYDARVRAITDGGSSSGWSEMASADLKGKQGVPDRLTMFKATEDQVMAVNLSWAFPSTAGDAAYVEIQQSGDRTDQNATNLTMVAYPSTTYTHTPLPHGFSTYYRARIIDKLGFKSTWSDWAIGKTSADGSMILDYIKDSLDGLAGIEDMKEDILNNSEALKDLANKHDADVKVFERENADRKAEIIQVNDAWIEADQIQAQQINQVKVQNDQTAAAVQNKLDATIDSGGNPNAYYVNKLAVKYNGKEYSSGMVQGIGAYGTNGEIASYVAFYTNRFLILNPNTGGGEPVFGTDGNGVYMKDAYIRNLSIGSGKIANELVSDNWHNLGAGGWSLQKANNRMEFNDENNVTRVRLGRLW